MLAPTHYRSFFSVFSFLFFIRKDFHFRPVGMISTFFFPLDYLIALPLQNF